MVEGPGMSELKIEDIQQMFEQLRAVQDNSPKAISMGEQIAYSIRENEPVVWKDFIAVLRQNNAGLVLIDGYGGLARIYDIWKEDA